MKKNSSPRKKTPSGENSSTTRQSNQNKTESLSHESTRLRITNKVFGIEKVIYSFAGVLIFISGIYFGTKYLPADVVDKYTFSPTPTPLFKKENNLFKRSTTTSYFEPEDFFPAAEFRKQSAILLGCQNNLNKMPELYVELAKTIGGRVPLFGVVPTEMQAHEGASMLKRYGLPPKAMRFLVIPSNSIWIRDYAPFVLRYDQDRALLIDAKYQTRTERERRKQDEYFSMEMARLLDLPVRSIPLMMEGGNMLSNGDGLILTSGKTIAVNEQQGNFEPQQIMSMFNDYMGAHSVYSFAPLVEEPNGHIDMFVTLLDKNIAVVGQVSPAVDPESSRHLDETADMLASLNTTVGPMKVSRIPLPPKWGTDWRSYTNVIIANKLLLMPSFSDVDPALESKVESIYRSVLPPDWDVRRINCDKLVLHHGQLHCISYNLPNFIDIDNLLNQAIPQLNQSTD